MDKFKKYIAFSLIELMFALVTISLIAASFSPVITKRLSSEAAAQRNSSKILSDCKRFDEDGYCTLCYATECVACNRPCKQNEHLNVKTCKCEKCSDRTKDGKCSRCLETGCYGCVAGYYCEGNDCKTCTECPPDLCCPEGTRRPIPCQEQYNLE